MDYLFDLGRCRQLSRPVFAGIVFALSVLAAPVHGADKTNIAAIEEFHDVLLATMKEADSLGVAGRYERLADVIAERFHLRLMIQVAASSHWRKAAKEERQQLAKAFEHLTIATYAAQFDGYSGQKFVTVGIKDGPQETTLVETRIVDPDGEYVALVYVTRQFKGRWWVVDVLLDTGISELARKRSEYRQILKTGGISGLIDTLNSKADSLLAQ